MGIQEDINLRLAKVIEESGSGFAFPSQTLYLAKDQGLSQDKKAEAEKRVREWMENDELRIPDFDPDTIESLKEACNIQQKVRKRPKMRKIANSKLWLTIPNRCPFSGYSLFHWRFLQVGYHN